MAVQIDTKTVGSFLKNLYPQYELYSSLAGAYLAVFAVTSPDFTGLKFKKGLIVLKQIAIPFNTILAVANKKVVGHEVYMLATSLYAEFYEVFMAVDIELKLLKPADYQYTPDLVGLVVSENAPTSEKLVKKLKKADMVFMGTETGHMSASVKVSEKPKSVLTIDKFENLGDKIVGVSVGSIYIGAILADNFKAAVRISSNNTVVSIRVTTNETLANKIDLKSYGFTGGSSSGYLSTHLVCKCHNEVIKLLGSFYSVVGQHVPDCKRLAITKLLQMSGITA